MKRNKPSLGLKTRRKRGEKSATITRPHPFLSAAERESVSSVKKKKKKKANSILLFILDVAMLFRR